MKYLCLTTLLFLIAAESYAQSGRLKGSRYVQAGAGFTGVGPLVSGYAGLSFDARIKGALGGGFGISNQSDISYKYLFLDGYGSFAMYNTNRFFYFNGVAGISFAGDLINDFKSDTYDKSFSFNYGVFGGAEAEFYANRNLVLVLGANQRYYIKPEFAHWRVQVTASLRFILR